jgi:hypothetical protein
MDPDEEYRWWRWDDNIIGDSDGVFNYCTSELQDEEMEGASIPPKNLVASFEVEAAKRASTGGDYTDCQFSGEQTATLQPPEAFIVSASSWNQQGPAIVGDGADDDFGISVAASTNARTIAIGAPGYYADDSKRPCVNSINAIHSFVLLLMNGEGAHEMFFSILIINKQLMIIHRSHSHSIT